MKKVTLVALVLCTVPAYSKKPHTHHHHTAQSAEKKPDAQAIVANIFGIIMNGLAIAQGAASPNGQNHIAIAQHAGNIIHEFNKAHLGKRLTKEEIIQELKKLNLSEIITKKALTTHVAE